MEREIWGVINGFEGLYEVSNTGKVRSLDRQVFHRGNQKLHNIRGRLLKTRFNNCGYVEVRLSKEGKHYTKFVHRLIGEAFIPNPDNKCCIDHVDGKKSRNAMENLRWLTHSENMRHAYALGLIKSTTKSNIQQQKPYSSEQ